MLGQGLKNVTSRTAGLAVWTRPFSTTTPARVSMEELLLEIPPELRIGVTEKKSKSRGPKREDDRVPARKETISFGRDTGAPSQKRSAERLYKREEGASSGFGGLMGNKRSAPGSSERYPSSRSDSRPQGGQRGPRDESKRTSQSPRDDSNRPTQGSHRKSSPRERVSVEGSASAAPAHRPQQVRPQDYAPVQPRGQEDLFGTTSLLDIDVAEMGQMKGDNAEYAESNEAISAHPNTALHRALLSVGGYSHLVPAPLESSLSEKAILDPKTNRETLHRFAAHHADFTLARGVNVGEGQRGVAKGVIMGRLGVKS